MIIQNNPSECSSEEEVLEANCSVNTEDVIVLDFKITSNVLSVGSKLHIESEANLDDSAISIFNLNGSVIQSLTSENSYIDLPSDLISGMYLLRVKSGNRIGVKKFIVY